MGNFKNEIGLAQEYKNNFENVNKEFYNIQKKHWVLLKFLMS